MHVSAFLVFLDFLQTLAKIYCVWKCVDFTQKFSAPAAKLDLYLCFAHCVFGQVIVRGVLYMPLRIPLSYPPPRLNIAKWFSHSRRIPHSLRALLVLQIYDRLWCMFIPFCWHCTVPSLRLGFGIRANAESPSLAYSLTATRSVINKWLPWEGTRKLKVLKRKKRKPSSRY